MSVIRKKLYWCHQSYVLVFLLRKRFVFALIAITAAGLLSGCEKKPAVSEAHTVAERDIAVSYEDVGMLISEDGVLEACMETLSGEITLSVRVNKIGDGAFRDCTEITGIIIPDSVTEIGDSAFSGCTGLTSIAIPESVTKIDWGAFEGCTGLTSITLPDSVTEIGSSAFSGCTGLTGIAIPFSQT